MVGYSRLIGLDDIGTLERLRSLRSVLIDPAINEHGGRIVQTGGDSLLIVFDSIDGAVRCAVNIQQLVPDHDGDQPPDRAIRFRVGINIGDVIADGTDLHGDGVNVAARLQAECPPGGICVSRAVRDHVHSRLDLVFEQLGPLHLKNIARPVWVYTLHPASIAGLPRASVSSIAWSPPPVAAPRLSIVVLPFTNLSDDREQQYFADGITEDVTTDLSRLANMFVISGNTAFTFRNRPVNTKQIGRELGVRYVLEGSVRRSGNQLRINAQLIDAATDAHLWAERFDRDTGDMFALQNEITSRIANTLGVELIAAEVARPTERPDALDYILRGRAAQLKQKSQDSYAEPISMFEHALALDPQSVEARSRLAGSLAGRVLNGMTGSAAADLARAEGLVDQAMAASPRSAYAHLVKGDVLFAQHRWEEAVLEFETALALNRNMVGALNGLGWCKLLTGSIEEVIPLVDQAIRLSPRDPGIGNSYLAIGSVHLLQSRTDEAIIWLEKARNHHPAAGGFAAASPPPMPSEVRPNAPPPNSPKPGG